MANALILPPLPFTAAATGTVSGYDPANLGLDYAGMVWRSPTGGSTYSLTFDMGGDIDADTVMLFGLGGNITAPVVVRVQLATSAQGPAFSGTPTDQGGTGANSYWIDRTDRAPFAGSEPISVGNGVFFWQRPAGAPTAARYLRLTFANLTAAAFIQASRAAIGKALTLERNFSLGGSFGVRDLGSLDFSPRGVLLRRRAAKLRTIGLTFSSINKDEVEAQTKPLLERIGNTEMIALLTDPAEHPQRQRRAYFGPLVGDLSHTQRRSTVYEAKVNQVSIF